MSLSMQQAIEGGKMGPAMSVRALGPVGGLQCDGALGRRCGKSKEGWRKGERRSREFGREG